MKELKLNLTDEQLSLLQFALATFHTTINQRHEFDLDNDMYFDDLVKKVYSVSSHSSYKPWSDNETC
ncbi:MAG: hypothetical protein QW745_07685 [Thermoplasmata archaeon]